jgi:hypothetical protein
VGAGESGARVSVGLVEGFLSLPIGTDSRPIPIGRPRLSGAGRKRPLGRHRPGRGICGVVYLPQRPTRALAGCGPSVATKTEFFSGIFYRISFQFFCSVLNKFQIVFSIQIIPTKNLFREFKSYRNISKKFKVNEFLIHNFRCK